MSRKAAEAFRAQVGRTPALEAEVREAATHGGAGIVQLGARHGFEFTVEELEALMAEGELSELELELISGGGAPNCGGSNV